MHDHFLPAGAGETRGLTLLAAGELDAWLSGPGAAHADWVRSAGFRAKTGAVVALPDGHGGVAGFLGGLGSSPADLWAVAAVAGALPSGDYALTGWPTRPAPQLVALGWTLGQYRFGRYRGNSDAPPRRLAMPEGVNVDGVRSAATASALTRDLVNTPAADMGPEELEDAVRRLAEAHAAQVSTVVGDDLVHDNFPAIHAVGRASSRAPRLIDMTCGAESLPKVTLVGKGVCFDSGGLNIKPAGGMLLMKKDMGGAAHVIGLAQMILDAGLSVRLRLLVSAVENSISGDAYRPGDVIDTRKGLTVEIGNTDAEGRLVLCDALALADEESPDMLIDMATLTGAARVALGPDLPAMYCDDDELAEAIGAAGKEEQDPVWRMPMWKPYGPGLDSKVADMNNIAAGPMAGSIYAALFLDRFVENAARYVHFDVFAWNPADRPGRLAGGEAQGIRALFRVLSEMYPPPA